VWRGRRRLGAGHYCPVTATAWPQDPQSWPSRCYPDGPAMIRGMMSGLKVGRPNWQRSSPPARQRPDCRATRRPSASTFPLVTRAFTLVRVTAGSRRRSALRLPLVSQFVPELLPPTRLTVPAQTLPGSALPVRGPALPSRPRRRCLLLFGSRSAGCEPSPAGRACSLWPALGAERPSTTQTQDRRLASGLGAVGSSRESSACPPLHLPQQ
jgi:hypothetical protein